jgi:NADH dehydrogenase
VRGRRHWRYVPGAFSVMLIAYMNKHIHLVVVGGGFAGMKLVRELRYEENIKITLISEDDGFRYSPTLYRTATGHRFRESLIGIPELIKGMSNVTFIKAKAGKIDRKKRVITTEDGHKFEYDYAVLALGVVTSYFGIPGLDQYSFGIKTIPEIHELRAHLHQALIEDNETDKNYVVVGAGPTGVETAAALRSYVKKIAKQHRIRHNKVNVELIEAADRVLPTFPKPASTMVARRLRDLGVKILVKQKVEGETETTLTASGRSIPTETVIWTAGVTMNPFYAANASEFKFNERKKVVVDDYMRVDDRVFVLGDNAATKYSGLALTAVHDGAYAAHCLEGIIHHKPVRKYKPRTPMSVVPAGPYWGLFQYRSLLFGGWPGAVMRVLGDYVGYSDIMGYWKALFIFQGWTEYEEVCKVCRSIPAKTAAK